MDYSSFDLDFSKIVVEEIDLPYGSQKFLKLSYGEGADNLLRGYQVILIADTIPSETNPSDYEGNRLATFIMKFPRNILSEVNTHRVFSRNSASSRARSIKSTIADVMDNPYIPLFTRNQKGMSGVFLSAEDREKAVAEWLQARDSAVYHALRLLLGDLMPVDGSTSELIAEYGELVDLYYEKVYNAEIPDPAAISVHKQNVNRILEPFSWHEAIITSSMWDNFIHLRDDLASAQPEIVALAKLVRKALELSIPRQSWVHLPFAEEEEFDERVPFADLRDKALVSATEAAQVSYKDKGSAKTSTANLKLAERLLRLQHLSPFEHVAFSSAVYHSKAEEEGLPSDEAKLRNNFGDNWVQLRGILTKG